MRILLLTQNDPFYLAENIDYLLQQMPEYASVVGCVVFDVAPFGKKKSILEQAKETYQTFGGPFFAYYSFKYLWSKFDPQKQVNNTLKKHNIPLIHLEKSVNNSSSLQKIKEYKPDLLISIAGNQIFKKQLIDLAPKGCLNLHTALLPKYRGLMPSFWVLKNDEEKTGVSVFFVDEGIDSGPILVQKEVVIGGKTQAELIRFTKKMGMDAIIESIEKIHLGNYDLIPNPDEQMTYYSKPTREDVKVFRENGKKFF